MLNTRGLVPRLWVNFGTILDAEIMDAAAEISSGRSLLNKKEGVSPSATIKDSSESSQTIDDGDNDKGPNLKHENTVVRVDTATSQSIAGLARAAQNTASQQMASNNAGSQSGKQEIMRVTQSLLDSVAIGDYDNYTKLCDSNMTCFEPEALGNLVQGMEFHKFYFDAMSTSATAAANARVVGQSKSASSSTHTTMLNPQVHMLGDDAAAVCYIRLTQFIDKNGEARTRQSQETRVWHKRTRGWQCVHLHRSGAPSATIAAEQPSR